jgi:hypothetical protein
MGCRADDDDEIYIKGWSCGVRIELGYLLQFPVKLYFTINKAHGRFLKEVALI